MNRRAVPVTIAAAFVAGAGATMLPDMLTTDSEIAGCVAPPEGVPVSPLRNAQGQTWFCNEIRVCPCVTVADHECDPNVSPGNPYGCRSTANANWCTGGGDLVSYPDAASRVVYTQHGTGLGNPTRMACSEPRPVELAGRVLSTSERSSTPGDCSDEQQLIDELRVDLLICESRIDAARLEITECQTQVTDLQQYLSDCQEQCDAQCLPPVDCANPLCRDLDPCQPPRPCEEPVDCVNCPGHPDCDDGPEPGEKPYYCDSNWDGVADQADIDFCNEQANGARCIPNQTDAIQQYCRCNYWSLDRLPPHPTGVPIRFGPPGEPRGEYLFPHEQADGERVHRSEGDQSSFEESCQ